jgi:hypothetical protein
MDVTLKNISFGNSIEFSFFLNEKFNKPITSLHLDKVLPCKLQTQRIRIKIPPSILISEMESGNATLKS